MFDQNYLGGVAQWSSHPPGEKKNWVRIPPGFKFIGENMQCCCES
jgi:hypothetical protein